MFVARKKLVSINIMPKICVVFNTSFHISVPKIVVIAVDIFIITEVNPYGPDFIALS